MRNLERAEEGVGVGEAEAMQGLREDAEIVIVVKGVGGLEPDGNQHERDQQKDVGGIPAPY